MFHNAVKIFFEMSTTFYLTTKDGERARDNFFFIEILIKS